MGLACFPLNPVSPQVPFEINDDEIAGKRKGGKLPYHPADVPFLSATRQTDLLRGRSEIVLHMINLARLHDKYGLKMFWEEKIESHVERMGNEDSRMNKSALSKLREEWVQRLQFRNQHVIETMREEQIRRAQRVQGILRV
ncbi:hypothetical protein F2P79_024230 [Pimephales promelas]|nr:hypothetical protein F2P79_024230 [Pimephales promelas]